MFVCTIAVMLHRIRTRTKLLCLSTACTGAFAGLLLVNKFLSSSHSCLVAECKENGLAYQRLKKNEISIKVNHPLIYSVDINYLPSNSPNEDRYAIGSLPESCIGLFAVIDGHKTSHCSEHLKHTLLPYVTNSLTSTGYVKGPLTVYREGEQVMDAGEYCEQWDDKLVDISSSLKKGFNDLDKNISEEGLEMMKHVEKGRSINEEGMLSILMRAIAGACALVAMVTNNMFYVASTGDCRAVLGTKDGGAWLATPLSKDQNARNEEEVKRIRSEHPGEEQTVIQWNRLLGSLMPFRSFGDVEQKWPAKILERIGPILAHYNTPPYLTAEPVVTSKSYTSNDKFLILATDGLWDKLYNEDAVRVVGATYHNEAPKTSFYTSKSSDSSCCVRENGATALLWKALGGDEKLVHEMLDVPQSISRIYRDDITIIVIHFK